MQVIDNNLTFGSCIVSLCVKTKSSSTNFMTSRFIYFFFVRLLENMVISDQYTLDIKYQVSLYPWFT